MIDFNFVSNYIADSHMVIDNVLAFMFFLLIKIIHAFLSLRMLERVGYMVMVFDNVLAFIFFSLNKIIRSCTSFLVDSIQSCQKCWLILVMCPTR